MSISLFTPFHTRNPLASKTINSTLNSKTSLLSQKQSSLSFIKTAMDMTVNNQSDQCTFQPKINDHKKSKRSLEKFLDDQFRYERSKVEKLSHLKEEKVRNEQSQITLTPQIDSSSRKMAKYMRQGSNESIFKRLSRERQNQHSNELVCSFSPQILNRSQSIKRNSDISSLLYNDAIRRQEKSQFMIQTQRNYTDRIAPKVNSNTNKLVCSKILSELYNLIKEEEVNPLVAILTLEDIFNVDLNPNKTQNSQTVNKILSFISETNEQHVEIVKTRRLHEFIAIIINAEEECFYFNKIQQETINEEFKHLYKERMTKEKRIPTPEKMSFKPQTLSASNKMAQCYREKSCQQIGEFLENQKVNLNLKDGEITIEDLFILNHLKRQQSNEKKRMEKERKELDECTFKPNIKSSIQSLEKSRKELKKPKITLKPTTKKEKRNEVKALEKENLDKSHSRFEAKNLPPPPRSDKKPRKSIVNNENCSREMEKIVLRMSAGRQKREFSNKIAERGYPKDENWTELQKNMHRTSVENLQKLRRLSFKEI